MALHSIYALCEPGTLNVRYVGKTQHTVKARLKEHVAKAKGSDRLDLHEWINGLGKVPDAVLLTTCPGDIVQEIERAWIVLFIDNGYDMLNVRDCNGRGRKPKPKINRCDDPVYFHTFIDRLIAEEAEQARKKATESPVP